MAKEKFGGFNFLIPIVTSMSIVKPWIITAWERHFYEQSRKWTKGPLRHMQKRSSRICLCLVFTFRHRKIIIIFLFILIICIALMSLSLTGQFYSNDTNKKACKIAVNLKPINSEPCPIPSAIKRLKIPLFSSSLCSEVGVLHCIRWKCDFSCFCALTLLFFSAFLLLGTQFSNAWGVNKCDSGILSSLWDLTSCAGRNAALCTAFREIVLQEKPRHVTVSIYFALRSFGGEFS